MPLLDVVAQAERAVELIRQGSIQELLQLSLRHLSLSDITFELLFRDSDRLAELFVRAVAELCSNVQDRSVLRHLAYVYALTECARQDSESARESDTYAATYMATIRGFVIPAVAVVGRVSANTFIANMFEYKQISLTVAESYSNVISKYSGHLPFIRLAEDARRQYVVLRNRRDLNELALAFSQLFTNMLQASRECADCARDLYSIIDNYFDDGIGVNTKIVCTADSKAIVCTIS